MQNMPSELEISLSKNGPFNVFSKILNNIDLKSFQIIIFFVEQEKEPWVFNHTNISHLLNSAAMIEALFQSEELYNVFVIMEEVKQNQSLIYKFLFSFDGDTTFLSAEEAAELDKGIENEIDMLNVTYVDSDFFKLEENESYQESITFYSDNSEEGMIANLIEKQMEAYGIKSHDEFNLLFDDFRGIIYGKYEFLEDAFLSKEKDSFLKLLRNEKFKNKYNEKLIEEFESFLSIFNELDIYEKNGVLFDLPLLGDMELILIYKNGVAHMSISLIENYIFYSEKLDKENNVSKQYNLNSEKEINELKNLIKTRKDS